MKVLLVLDQFDGATNGNTMSARRLADDLRKRGHEVKVAASGESREDKWGFGVFKLPVFNPLVQAQGFVFARLDHDKMREAVQWADLVHIMMPFPLSKQAVKIAKELDKPLTGAFHIQPENIWFNVGLGDFMPLINATYTLARKYIFRYFSSIHCPSRMIRDLLKEHGYESELRVISNGFPPIFHYQKRPKRKEFEGRFVIVMTARISYEKKQEVLIEAVRRSRHSQEIQLFLAGQGPAKEKIAKIGATLPNPVMMGFLSTENLIQLLSEADLYGYPSDIDIEPLSCLEAVASGLVPVISDSKRSGASQFALDDRSLFKSGDPDDMARKIDYWIEHEEERKAMEREYASFAARNFSMESAVDQMLDFFDEEMRRHGKRFQ